MFGVSAIRSPAETQTSGLTSVRICSQRILVKLRPRVVRAAPEGHGDDNQGAGQADLLRLTTAAITNPG